MIGRELGHYRIKDEISRGGMGVVYRAVDTKLNRDVALKVLPADLLTDPERKRRFIQEAQAASALEHPHIAVIHGIDEQDGVTFIAMELIRGEKLRDAMARSQLSPPRALDLAIEVAEGLARAHDKGIVHRDLKPANVMLTEDGHAKVIDFGLAKLWTAWPAPTRKVKRAPATRPIPASSWAPRLTCPPSRPVAAPWTTAPTSLPSASCCTRCWTAPLPSGARPTWTCSTPSRATRRRRSGPRYLPTWPRPPAHPGQVPGEGPQRSLPGPAGPHRGSARSPS